MTTNNSTKGVIAKHEDKPLNESHLFKDFPTENLPRAMADLVRAGGQAVDCSEAGFAMPLLVTLAGFIGSAARLRLKNGYDIPSILWMAIVQPSGSAKSPPLTNIKQHLIAEPSNQYREKFDEEMTVYRERMKIYSKDLSLWKRSKSETRLPPLEPEKPIEKRIELTSATLEAIAKLLQDNPKGIVLLSDELSAWICSFGMYNNKAGADLAQWLSLYSSTTFTHDRKTEGISLYVQHPCISIFGTIQPKVRDHLFGGALEDNGLAARVLFAQPPAAKRSLNEMEIDPAIISRLAARSYQLLSLEPANLGNRDWCPHVISMTREAKRLYLDWHNRHQDLVGFEMGNARAAAYAKLSEIPLRLGLVFHLFENPGAIEDRLSLEVDTMQDAINVTEWFVAEAIRIFDSREFTASQELDQQILEALSEGPLSKHEMRDKKRSLRKAQEEGALEPGILRLVKASLVESEVDTETGGRPGTKYQRTNKPKDLIF